MSMPSQIAGLTLGIVIAFLLWAVFTALRPAIHVADKD